MVNNLEEWGMGERVLFPTSVAGFAAAAGLCEGSDRPMITPGRRRIIAGRWRRRFARRGRCRSVRGFDVITDGEWWRKSYIGVIAELAHGFELSRNPADGRPWTIVVDKLSPKNPGFIAREAQFLKSITKRQIKATLPAAAAVGRADVGSEDYRRRRIRRGSRSSKRACRFCIAELELLKEQGAFGGADG